MTHWSLNHNKDNINEQTDAIQCHPELMTKNQLIKCMEEHHVKLPNGHSNKCYEYYNLIDLYNRVLLPLSQRVYGSNRQSTVLRLKQDECNRTSLKRKLEDTINEENKRIKCNSSITNNSNNLFSQTAHQKLDKQNGSQSKSEFEAKRQRISWP